MPFNNMSILLCGRYKLCRRWVHTLQQHDYHIMQQIQISHAQSTCFLVARLSTKQRIQTPQAPSGCLSATCLSYYVADTNLTGAECMHISNTAISINGGYKPRRFQVHALQQHVYLIVRWIQTLQAPSACSSVVRLSYYAVDTNVVST